MYHEPYPFWPYPTYHPHTCPCCGRPYYHAPNYPYYFSGGTAQATPENKKAPEGAKSQSVGYQD